MVEHLYMALGFHVERFLHRRAAYQYGHVAVQHIHLLLSVRNHHAGRPDTRHADDDGTKDYHGYFDAQTLERSDGRLF